MEQIYIDKFDEYREKVTLKNESFKKEYLTFMNEFFTEDVKNMLRALPTISSSRSYEKTLPSCGVITITPSFDIYYKHESICAPSIPREISERSYAEVKRPYEPYKNVFSNYAETYNKNYETFCFIRNHAQDIVDMIGKSYEDVTNNRLKDLEKLDEFFNASDGKVKHIKVTVEWKDGD